VKLTGAAARTTIFTEKASSRTRRASVTGIQFGLTSIGGPLPAQPASPIPRKIGGCRKWASKSGVPSNHRARVQTCRDFINDYDNIVAQAGAILRHGFLAAQCPRKAGALRSGCVFPILSADESPGTFHGSLLKHCIRKFHQPFQVRPLTVANWPNGRKPAIVGNLTGRNSFLAPGLHRVRRRLSIRCRAAVGTFLLASSLSIQRRLLNWAPVTA